VQRMDTNRIPKQALQYRPKRWRNIGWLRKRWKDQLHLEDQGTANMPNPSCTWRWWEELPSSNKTLIKLLTDYMASHPRWQHSACESDGWQAWSGVLKMAVSAWDWYLKTIWSGTTKGFV
jgi:hypothetical protein